MRRSLLIGIGIVSVVAIAGAWSAHHKLKKFHAFVRQIDGLELRLEKVEAAQGRVERQDVSGLSNRLDAVAAQESRDIDATHKQIQEAAQNTASDAARKRASDLATVEQSLTDKLTKEVAQRKILTAGPADSVFELFGRVSPYDRDGLLEVYGGALHEPKRGPIAVAETAFDITHDHAWVVWSPDLSPAADSSMLAVDLAETPAGGTIEIGFVMSNGQTFVFDHRFGQDLPRPPNLLPPLVPDEFVAAAAAPTDKLPLQRVGRSLRAPLPDGMLASMSDKPDSAVRHWYVKVDGAAGSRLRIRRIALVQPNDEAKEKQVSVSGKVRGGTLAPGSMVRLLDERGEQREQLVGADGSFSFDRLDRDAPISLSVTYAATRYYSSLGRWFAPGYSRDDLVLDLRPRYVNSDGHPPDPKKAKFVTPRAPLDTGAIYEAHARQVWPGGGEAPQQYDSTTFTNNMGYVDRDRFYENFDRCVRIVDIGSSHAVALQVRPFEKYNILMEEELGVALGRCVDVISAGRDNGDIGANYPSIEYAVRFHPDAIVVESGSTLIFQLQPQLLQEGFGWDYEHSGTGNFVRDYWEELNWRPPAADYGLYATPPTFPELIKGVPFFSSLSVPQAYIPNLGNDAFDRLAAIVTWLHKKYPVERFILQSGLDQAQCGANCLQQVTINSNTVDIGATIFRTNFDHFCVTHNFECINPPIPDAIKPDDTPLTFTSDGHYSVRGHQWVADQLSAALLKMMHFSAQSRTTER